MPTRPALVDAVVFWETGRLGYNAVLALAVFVVAMATDGWLGIGRNWLTIVVLGAIANALYCAVYPVELLAQLSPFTAAWRPLRGLLWCAGTGVATLIAVAFLTGFANGGAAHF